MTRLINNDPPTRNIRKPGVVGNFNFCTFTQNRNGLIGWFFKIPANAYCHTLAGIVKDNTDIKKGRRKMKIETHNIDDTKIAEVNSDETIINNTEDGLDLLGNLYYQGFDRIIINEKNITVDFFELKNGIAGEILQKFSTYRVRLAIVGDFSKYKSKSLTDFIFESNKGRHINFVNSTTEALKILSAK